MSLETAKGQQENQVDDEKACQEKLQEIEIAVQNLQAQVSVKHSNILDMTIHLIGLR